MKYSETQDKAIKFIASNGGLSENEFREDFRITTLRALKRRNAVEVGNDGIIRLTDTGKGRAASVKESIGRPRTNKVNLRWLDVYRETFDIGTADYAFWDRVRSGTAKGLEVAGLFAKPIASKKAAWLVGDSPEIDFDDVYTNEAMKEWWEDNHSSIIEAVEEAASLGDSYILLNPSGSLTVIPPHVIQRNVNPNDYTESQGWTIRQVYAHPTEITSRQVIENIFEENSRTRTVYQGEKVIKREIFLQPLSDFPIIHIRNNARPNERFGHPESEAILKAMHDYGEVFDAAVSGNIRQGRPTPTFSSMGSASNVQDFLNTFGEKKTRENMEGELEEFYEIAFSADNVVVVGESGDFSYEAPGSFTEDTLNILQIIFYLIIQHSELPEFIFGTAIRGSRASAESQFPPFLKWIQKERVRLNDWLKQLLFLAAEQKALTDRRITPSRPKIDWGDIFADNKDAMQRTRDNVADRRFSDEGEEEADENEEETQEMYKKVRML